MGVADAETVDAVPSECVDRPLVSVLVACFDHVAHLDRALDSVAAQTYDRLELVIVDDRSTDGSVAGVRRWLERSGMPATFVAHEENVGICAVLNELLSLSTGEYCVLLDTDDWFEPDRVQRHVDRFASLGPEVAVVYGDATIVDESGTSTGESFIEHHLGGRPVPEDDDVFDALLAGNFLPTCAVTVRRSALDDVGGYDETLAYDDFDMWLRLADRYRFVACEGSVANYRLLPGSMSHSPAWSARLAASTIRILAKWVSADAVGSVRSRRHRVAAQLRRQAILVSPGHPDDVRVALRAAERLVPSKPWRIIGRSGLLEWPGGARFVNSTTRLVRRTRAAVRGSSS